MTKLQDAANFNSSASGQSFSFNGAGFTPSFQTGFGFSAYKSSDQTNATGNGTTCGINFDTNYFDTTGGYSNGTFTVPSSGIYAFYISICLGNLPNASLITNCMFVKNGSTLYTSNYINPYSARDVLQGLFTLQGSFVAQLSKNDTITNRLQISGAAGDTITVKGGNYTYFCGALVR